jgi:hypothetical protein
VSLVSGDSVQIYYPEPVAMDASPNYSLQQVQGLRSGANFSIGQNPQLWTAVDVTNKFKNCLFTIEVIGQLTPRLRCFRSFFFCFLSLHTCSFSH